jgi:penicillin-binding protein-related factor A (putative recombinase)
MQPGKQFEQDFQKSIPIDYYWYRLRDCPSGWTSRGEVPDFRRFTPRNGYDLFLYADGMLFTLELKSTKGQRWPLSNMSELQEQELSRAHAHRGVYSGLVVNYREEEETYLLPITAVWQTRLEGVKSINMDRAEKMGIRVPQRKLKVHYRYDVESMVRHAIASRYDNDDGGMYVWRS